MPRVRAQSDRRRLPATAALLAAAMLVACEQQGAENTDTPDTPPPPATGLQQPTEGETGLPDGGEVLDDARETAEEMAEAARQAGEEAKREAEQQVEKTRQQAEQQVEEVSQEARETMETYLGDLGELGELLGGVNNQFSAAAAAPKATGLIESLEASMKQLEQLAPEQLATLKSLYADSLAPLVQKVQAEVTRLTSSDSFATLRPILQDLPLLQPQGEGGGA